MNATLLATAKSQSPLVTPQPSSGKPYLLSVEQYVKITQNGIFDSDDRVELIEGILESKPVENPPHARILTELMVFFAKFHGDQWVLRSQNQINLDRSAPEPDLAILRGPRNLYANRHAVASDIELIVEVSDTSLPFDSTTKLEIYARNLLPVYWIVNIPDRRIEVYANPVSGETPRYLNQTIYVTGQTVPVVLAGQQLAELPVADLFNG